MTQHVPRNIPERSGTGFPFRSDGAPHGLQRDERDVDLTCEAVICIHHLFERRAAKIPSAVAVVFKDRHLTYGELDRRANRLARYLRSKGVKPEVLVGIFMERSEEMIVGLLGVLKAGGVYVPLDPSYPAERITFMLENAGVSILLTHEGFLGTLPALSLEVVCLDEGRESIGQENSDNLSTEVTGENLVYVLYTSGSTGRPKGVLVGHRGVVNMVLAQIEAFGLRRGSHVLQLASFSFDASVSEIFMALCSGAVLYMDSSDSLLPGPGLTDLLRERDITHCTIPPSILAALPVTAMNALRTLIVAGEACPGELVSQWSRGRDFFNAYGPTETTVCATFTRCFPGADPPSIGRPIVHTQVYLLSEELQPVPPGVPGELYIGGTGLARGYINRPDLTAERFIPHFLCEEIGERLYRTGDAVRCRSGGDIEFIGRLDRQVKIRGFRVELGEIEAVLARHEGVRQAAVLARENTPGDKRLVAYIVCNPEHVPKDVELRCFLGQELPEYMVPAAFIPLDSMPLTPSGKVDRQALPAPHWGRRDIERGYTAPESSTEKVLAEIFGGLLGLDQVGVHDDFFELGGHSLLASRLVTMVMETFGRNVPLPVVFENPTVSDLAKLIDRAGTETVMPPPIARVQADTRIPLTFQQEQVWYFLQLAPDNRAYNFQFTIRFTGGIDRMLLERSVTEIITRHEILRTTFSEVEGNPAQVIHEPWEFGIREVDLRSIPEQERERRAEELIQRELQHVFDVTKLPLLKGILYRLAHSDFLYLQIEHHLIHDGWSHAVFLRELSILYESYSRGEVTHMPEPSAQYAAYAVWQRRWLESKTYREHLECWIEMLAGSPHVLELPLDRPRPKVRSFQGDSIRIDIPVGLYRSLRSFSRREGVTLFMTMFSAFATLLMRYTGQEDILVGSGVADRGLRETEDMLGMVVNTLILRADLSGNPTFREVLARVRKFTVEAFAHQDVPLERVIEQLRPKRDPARNPLFQVLFSFHDSPVPDLNFAGAHGQLIERHNRTAKNDMNVIIIPRVEQRVGHEVGTEAERLTIFWEFSTDIFDTRTVQRMVENYIEILGEAVRESGKRVSDFAVIPERELACLLDEWNNTRTEYPRGSSIQELFEARVEEAPDTVALVFGEAQLCYGELNRRANRVAHYLRSLGVHSEVAVGVSVERSLEMVVGLLGILKAGGVYVPLDPLFPTERLAFMLRDTGVSVLVTEERLVDRMTVEGIRVVCLDSDWGSISARGDENPLRVTEAENLACVLYTSGSTGEPKGVEIKHRGVVRLLFGVEYVRLGPSERFVQMAPVSFDASTFELWGALLHGGRCILYAKGIPAAGDIGRVIERFGVSVLWLTSALFNAVIDENHQVLAGVEQILVGGEALSVAHVRRALEALPATRLINGYGPTEVTTFTCCYSIPGTLEEGVLSIPIGRPIANTRVYVVDRHLRPVPIGVWGELLAGGDGVARGYLNRPTLTVESFIPDPFSNQPGARLYRTGDIVRYLPDGNIEFRGRIDRQVKIRGLRIEPGEIEAALVRHPAVREALVLAREDVPGERYLAAYIVNDRDHAPSSVELRNFLGKRLPGYMIPTAFVVLDEMPLKPSMKVDQIALPVPEPAQPGPRYEEPRSEIEQVVTAVWEEVLGLENIGIHDDFFELGGHSLLATRVITRLRSHFRTELPLVTIFELATVAELAGLVETMLSATSEKHAVTGDLEDGREVGRV